MRREGKREGKRVGKESRRCLSDRFRSGWAWGSGLPRVGVGEGRVAPGRRELNRG